MMQALSQARLAARKATETLYEHSCEVSEYRQRCVKGETKQKPAVVCKNVPCRLSFSAAPAHQTDTANNIDYDALLLLSPDISIKPGSLLTVTHNGGTAQYEQSGEPAVYATHQEIRVRRVDKT